MRHTIQHSTTALTQARSRSTCVQPSTTLIFRQQWGACPVRTSTDALTHPARMDPMQGYACARGLQRIARGCRTSMGCALFCVISAFFCVNSATRARPGPPSIQTFTRPQVLITLWDEKEGASLLVTDERNTWSTLIYQQKPATYVASARLLLRLPPPIPIAEYSPTSARSRSRR